MKRSSTSWLVLAALAIAAAGIARAQEYKRDASRSGLTRALDVSELEADPNVASPPRTRSRYGNLLRQFEVASDRESYGDFYDYGYWSGSSYAGQSDLPAGYWVYLAPNWYIFGDDVSGTPPGMKARAWGPEQATGAPDTWPRSGDLTTAWASKTQDGQREWLELTYDGAVKPVAVTVYETFNPGAVDRVTGYDTTGKEVELWAGSDPTPAGRENGVSVIPIKPQFELSRVRIYLDSPKIPGWNEIDAVGLLDEAGNTHWAKSATASSTYAEVGPLPATGGPTDELNSSERLSAGHGKAR